MSLIIIFLVTGIISGFIAGLLGVGGGIIIVPISYFVLLYLDYSSLYAMHIAIASSLGIICFTSSEFDSYSALCGFNPKTAILGQYLKIFLK